MNWSDKLFWMGALFFIVGFYLFVNVPDAGMGTLVLIGDGVFGMTASIILGQDE